MLSFFYPCKQDLEVDPEAGSVSFRLELTTPACPIKDDFERAVGGLLLGAAALVMVLLSVCRWGAQEGKAAQASVWTGGGGDLQHG